MNTTQTIVLATGNAHKVDELQALLASHGVSHVELVRVTDLVPDFAPEEVGADFETNAWIKAQLAHELTGLPALADDSGIEVNVLDGAPGVHSARFSGPQATDASNRAYMKQQLSAHGVTSSEATFRCVLCLVTSTYTAFAQGSCDGRISSDERGDNGFGYDAMFTPTGSTRTYGEQTADEKAQYSHRARAVTSLASQLLHQEEPLEVPPIDLETLVQACVASASSAWDRLRQVLTHAILVEDHVTPVYEALLQTYLFAGYPVALEALMVLHDVVLAKFPAYQLKAESFDEEVFRARGTLLFDTIYSGVAERMMSRLRLASPDLADWMILEGYGKTLCRPGLPIVTRELCIVAVLAVLGHQRQLTSHVRGAYLVGATERQLLDIATVVLTSSGPHAYDVLVEQIHQYSPRTD